jgi:acetate kinase
LALEPVSVSSADEAVILALNSGSSSLKFGLYRVAPTETEMLFSGEAHSIGDEKGDFHARDADGNTLLTEKAALPGYAEVIVRIASLLPHFKMPSPAAVGHRVVHGGPKLRQHCLVDAETLVQLEAANAFAPLHTPSTLAVIRAAREQFQDIPHMACFDTAFHADLPDVAKVLPLPKALRLEGVERYGFHGLSCESIVHQLAENLPDRLIVAHLGNGASLTAIKNGKSIDTSMGLTPNGGVIMGTRTGDLDPGILAYLMREKKLDAARLEDLIDRQSGLKGISDIGGDMRILHERAKTNADARLAIEMFCYSVRKQLAAMIAALDGVDMIVFTGGIGENDVSVRADICDGLSWIGISLDDAENKITSNPISDRASRCAVRVLPSQEDEQIARHCWKLLEATPPNLPPAT